MVRIGRRILVLALEVVLVVAVANLAPWPWPPWIALVLGGVVGAGTQRLWGWW